MSTIKLIEPYRGKYLWYWIKLINLEGVEITSAETHSTFEISHEEFVTDWIPNIEYYAQEHLVANTATKHMCRNIDSDRVESICNSKIYGELVFYSRMGEIAGWIVENFDSSKGVDFYRSRIFDHERMAQSLLPIFEGLCADLFTKHAADVYDNCVEERLEYLSLLANTPPCSADTPTQDCPLEDRIYWIDIYRNRPQFTGIHITDAQRHSTKLLSLADFFDYLERFGMYKIHKQLRYDEKDLFAYGYGNRCKRIDIKYDHLYILAYLLTLLYPIMDFKKSVSEVLDTYLS